MRRPLLPAALAAVFALASASAGAAKPVRPVDAPEIVDLSKLRERSPGEEAANDLFRGDEDDGLGSFADILGDDFEAAPMTLPEGPGFGAIRKSPQLEGLAASHRVVAAAEGDLDGDGLRETVVAFGPAKAGGAGGFALIGSRGGRFRLLWSGLYERSAPESVEIDRNSIRAQVRTPDGPVRVVLEHGADFRLRGEAGDPLAGIKLKVSSRARGERAEEHSPENLLDGDHDTVWCTQTIGTGVGEWVQVELAAPADVGLVGVIGGDYRSQERWRDTNRLFRYELIAETRVDRTTLVEDMDLTKMLTLPTMGKRVSVIAKDQRQTSWADLAHRGVVGIKLEAASVHLGVETDELCLAEIELGLLLPEPKRPPPELPVASPAAAPALTPAAQPGEAIPGAEP